jgi:methylated-DNA-protein-cysteine methyltransferase-like protein
VYESAVSKRCGARSRSRSTARDNALVDDWTRRVYRVVREIPRGRVASYGLVAVVAGRPRAARAVGNVMLECDDPTVPCHRVVHADGSLAPTFRDQRARLRREGVPFAGARVDLRPCLWTPRLPRPDAVGFFGSGSSSPSRSRRMMRKDSPAR